MTSKIECRLASTTVCLCFVVVAVVFGHAELGLGQMLQSALKGFGQVQVLLLASYPAKRRACLT